MNQIKYEFVLKTDNESRKVTITAGGLITAIAKLINQEKISVTQIRRVEAKPEITFEMVKELIPKSVTLAYVDYRSSLDDHESTIQEAISTGEYDQLNDLIEEWYRDERHDNEQRLFKEIRKDLQSKYDLKKSEAKQIMNQFHYEIQEEIWDRDDSDILNSLANNTGRLIAHYDTGFYVESESWSWTEEEITAMRNQIKDHLGILETTKYDSAIDMMVQQASYGGQLLIFFNLDLSEFLGEHENRKTIKFKDAMIGIVNHGNGSGDVLEVAIKEEIVLPYDRENVFLEKSIKYNWTYSIAGMCYDWADSTNVSFSEEETEFEIEKSPTGDHLKREAELNKIFNEGGCTFGDMDIRRHRKAEYINSFPCGNKCHDCGTFWID